MKEMAYNNYYAPYQNQYYSQMQVPQAMNPPVQAPVQVQTPNMAQPQNNQSGLIWVQGEAGAKSYLVAPGVTVMLMDSETQRFYLKSSDASGMPLPLRVFEYTETTQKGPEKAAAGPAVDLSTFATKAEFDAFREEINGILQSVPRQVTKTVKGTVKENE